MGRAWWSNTALRTCQTMSLRERRNNDVDKADVADIALRGVCKKDVEGGGLGLCFWVRGV